MRGRLACNGITFCANTVISTGRQPMRPGKPGNIGKRASAPEMQINDIYPAFQQTQLMQYIIQYGIIFQNECHWCITCGDFLPGVKMAEASPNYPLAQRMG